MARVTDQVTCVSTVSWACECAKRGAPATDSRTDDRLLCGFGVHARVCELVHRRDVDTRNAFPRSQSFVVYARNNIRSVVIRPSARLFGPEGHVQER